MQQSSSVEHFRIEVQHEIEELTSLCLSWNEIKEANLDLSDDHVGEIMVAIGQAELLMKERFTQFSHLVDDCEFERGEQKTTVDDLHGFWETICFQIQDVLRKFVNLEELQKNDWVMQSPVISQAPKPKQRKQLSDITKLKNSSKGSATSVVRAHILAAKERMRLQQSSISEILVTVQVTGIDATDNRENVSPKRVTDIFDNLSVGGKEESTFDAGFFQVCTPVKLTPKKRTFDASANVCSPCPRTVSSQFLLASPALRDRMRQTPPSRKDYSPLIRVTRSMKKQARHLASIAQLEHD